MTKCHLLIAFACLLSSCTTFTAKTDAEKSKSDPPKLLKPVVRKIWIPSELRNGGGEWVEGHFMYRIEKETTWSR